MAKQNITQNHIIMVLEDVVPQMQKSDDPTGVLLKYASDHNFPPAVLERCGHMFNSLKTNSLYNLAKEASHRGDYISTLDVDDLIKQYESFKPNEVNYSKIQIPNNGTSSMAIKLASSNTTNKEGDISDLAILADVHTMSLNEDEIKFANTKENILNNTDLFKSNSFNVETPAEKPLFEKNPVDFEMQCKTAKQEAHLEYTKAVDIMEGIEKKFASVYATHSLRNGHIPYANLEYKVLANVDSEQYNSVKEAMDHLSEALKSRSMFLKETIKTASETGLLDDPEFIDDGKEAALFNDVLDYAEAYHHAKEASEFIKEIEETIKVAAAVVTAPGTGVVTVVQPGTGQQGPQGGRQRGGQRQNQAGGTTPPPPPPPNNPNLTALNNAINKLKQDKQNQSEKELAALNSFIKDTGDSAVTFLERGVVEPVKEAIRDTKSDMIGLFNAMNMARAEGNKSEKLSPVEAKVKKLHSRLVLEQLIYTDPILSKLDDDTLNSLMESYSTLVRKNPDLATDIGLLRPILRQIVASGGVDVNSATNMAKLHRLISGKSSGELFAE